MRGRIGGRRKKKKKEGRKTSSKANQYLMQSRLLLVLNPNIFKTQRHCLSDANKDPLNFKYQAFLEFQTAARFAPEQMKRCSFPCAK